MPMNANERQNNQRKRRNGRSHRSDIGLSKYTYSPYKDKTIRLIWCKLLTHSGKKVTGESFVLIVLT